MLKTKIILGYLGFIPFALFTILPWILGENWLRPSLISLVIYGAIILSFLGGIIWQSSKETVRLSIRYIVLIIRICKHFFIHG